MANNDALSWIKNAMLSEYGKQWKLKPIQEQMDAIASFMLNYTSLRVRKVDFISIQKELTP